MLSMALPSSCQPMLHTLMQRHGIDFTNYQPGSLLRRITQRMKRVGIVDYAVYAGYLASMPDECDQLFNMLLINHTAFFRDPHVWTTLATEIIPQIIAGRPAGAPLRIWSAGCATGQEPYSLAMLLADQFGCKHLAERVTIYATDVDANALEHARQARYYPWAVRMVPPSLLERYFVQDDRDYIIREELRRAVVTGQHNLLVDAPHPQIDLLLCRNALIYLNAPAQAHILRQLRGALAEDGLLVLGKADLALPARHGLRWVNMHSQIVAKEPDTNGTALQPWQAGERVYV